MPLQVVHAQHRLVQRRAQGTGHARAHQQRPGQARAAGVGHHIHLARAAARLGSTWVRQRQHAPDVVAAGQLGHHAAIGLVHVDLAVQRMGQQSGHTGPRCRHQGHTGFVAGRFDAQHQACGRIMCHRRQV
jgi:hypothetical protein